MAVTFYDMATDPPYPFFLGHTVLQTFFFIVNNQKIKIVILKNS